MRHVFFALLALAAPPAFAEEGMARLLSPAAGDELAAGSLVTIAWEEIALSEHVNEWEAFLSVDGGETWPLRITPHLDISIRRFAFRVPDLPTRDARLMLRFGDERREVGMEAPQRFSIASVASAASGHSAASWAPRSPRLSRGERAREGKQGVVVWVEGSREGGRLREVVAWDPAASLHGVLPADLLVLPLVAPASPRESLAPPAASPEPEPRTALRVVETRQPRPASIPVLLQTRRFNE